MKFFLLKIDIDWFITILKAPNISIHQFEREKGIPIG
jgi:hypothetical protein